MKKIPFLRTGKMIYMSCFLAGFALFLILGKAFLENNTLLNVHALKEIKDSVIDRGEFLSYIFGRRTLVLGLCLFLWWKGLGKWVIFALFGWSGVTMGACMYTCLFRYHFKGIFLWFFYIFRICCFMR